MPSGVDRAQRPRRRPERPEGVVDHGDRYTARVVGGRLEVGEQRKGAAAIGKAGVASDRRGVLLTVFPVRYSVP